MSRKHLPTVVAALLLLVAALACFPQLVRHPTDLLVGPQREGINDVTDQILAWRSYPQQSLSRFDQFPAWNPYGLAGIPWLGNPQTALFYPANWLFVWCSAPCLVGWMMVAHHWLAGMGTYQLCRRYGFAWSSAVLGGIAFLAAPYYVANTAEGHYNPVCIMGWVPWAFLAFERIRAGQVGGVAITALVLAFCFFCGHAQEVYYLALMLTAFLLLDAWHCVRRQRAADAFSLLLRWAGVGAATVGLVAVDLLPIRLYTRHSVRAGGFAATLVGESGADLANLWQLLNPFALGGPESYVSHSNVPFWENLTHFGLVPLLLAVCGVLAGGRRYPVSRFAGLWLAAVLFALGTHGPLFGMLHSWVPGIDYFRVPSRALFFASFATAVLAAAGIDALLASVRWPRVARAVAFGVIVLCTAELSLFASKVLRTIPAKSVRDDSPIVQFLANRDDVPRVLARQGLLSDREAFANGICKVHGYDPVPLLNYARLIDAMTRHRDPALEMGGFHPMDLREYHQHVVDLLGVRYAVLRLDHPPAEVQGWKRVAVGEVAQEFSLRGRPVEKLPFAIYENPHALPRAYVVGSARESGLGSDAIAKLAEMDPRQEVLLEKDVLPAGPRQEYQPARIVEYRANRVTVEATLDAPGYLVLSDVWYPGWQADVDGTATPVLAANIALRAVPLTAGSHRVIFRYNAPRFALGGLVAAVTVCALFGTLLLRGFRSYTGEA